MQATFDHRQPYYSKGIVTRSLYRSKESKSCTTPCFSLAHPPTARSNWSIHSSIGIESTLSRLSCSNHHYQVMFINVHTTYVVTNSIDEVRTIFPGYYMIGEIIAIHTTMTDTVFLISTKARSDGCIWIKSSYSIFSPMLGIFEKSLGYNDV